uniref:Sulfotransferase domain-containing protein n=1 Tax=Lutzomyia longipalpis TaxID=7200 RepID=A0A1B0CU05_LUTLO
MENISKFTKSLRSTCFLANIKVRSCNYKLILLGLIFTIFLTWFLLYYPTYLTVQTNYTRYEQGHQMQAKSGKIKRLPQAIIIGVKKGGTRALLQMLSLHPHIQNAGNEIHFFDRNENYLKGLKWYRKRMPLSFPGQITIEKTPGYFVTPEVPERVKAMNATIIIGVKKCGTYALREMLNLHPMIEIADRELRFFIQNEFYAKGLQYYREQMPFSYADQITIEKTPRYFLVSKTPQRIKAMDPDIKLILLVRDPVTRAISEYVHRRNSKEKRLKNNINFYLEEWDRTFEELAFFPNGSINESYEPIRVSQYHRFLPPWLEEFPREQLIVINGDELIKDPVSQLSKIETFLGLEHKITKDDFYFSHR